MILNIVGLRRGGQNKLIKPSSLWILYMWVSTHTHASWRVQSIVAKECSRAQCKLYIFSCLQHKLLSRARAPAKQRERERNLYTIQHVLRLCDYIITFFVFREEKIELKIDSKTKKKRSAWNKKASRVLPKVRCIVDWEVYEYKIWRLRVTILDETRTTTRTWTLTFVVCVAARLHPIDLCSIRASALAASNTYIKNGIKYFYPFFFDP